MKWLLLLRAHPSGEATALAKEWEDSGKFKDFASDAKVGRMTLWTCLWNLWV